MTLRLIHTSDWQIGKVFRFVDNATMGLLQEARLWAITRLGELARGKDVRHILVAGDVYDMEALSPRSLNQPLERMRNFAGVHWHLMPAVPTPSNRKSAQNVQVIIFTCWEQLFEKLGGRQLSLQPGSSEELASA